MTIKEYMEKHKFEIIHLELDRSYGESSYCSAITDQYGDDVDVLDEDASAWLNEFVKCSSEKVFVTDIFGDTYVAEGEVKLVHFNGQLKVVGSTSYETTYRNRTHREGVFKQEVLSKIIRGKSSDEYKGWFVNPCFDFSCDCSGFTKIEQLDGVEVTLDKAALFEALYSEYPFLKDENGRGSLEIYLDSGRYRLDTLRIREETNKFYLERSVVDWLQAYDA